MLRLHLLAASLLALAATAHASGSTLADLKPEIQRKPGAPQAVGVCKP